MEQIVSSGAYVAEDLTRAIIGAAIEVHKGLGPGLLESAYEVCLCDELKRAGIHFRRQVELPLIYKERALDCGYRIDLLVEETVVVEVKAVEKVISIHEAQLLTYLRLADKRVGLLINFNVAKLREGVTRRIL